MEVELPGGGQGQGYFGPGHLQAPARAGYAVVGGVGSVGLRGAKAEAGGGQGAASDVECLRNLCMGEVGRVQETGASDEKDWANCWSQSLYGWCAGRVADVEVEMQRSCPLQRCS